MNNLICIKGQKISKFLIKSEKVTLPLIDTKYLESMPMWKECYILLKKEGIYYRLIKFIFV